MNLISARPAVRRWIGGAYECRGVCGRAGLGACRVAGGVFGGAGGRHVRRRLQHRQGVPGAERVCVLGAAAAGVLRDRRRGAVCRCGAVVFDKLTNYCGNCGQALDWSDKISLKNY